MEETDATLLMEEIDKALDTAVWTKSTDMPVPELEGFIGFSGPFQFIVGGHLTNPVVVDGTAMTTNLIVRLSEVLAQKALKLARAYMHRGQS